MISVVTLAGGRPDHLRNVVLGLSRQTTMPAELIVAVIQDAPYDLPEAPFPIRQMMVSGPHLPLASARNAAAKACVGDKIVFLDMDCIPTPELLADYDRCLDEMDGLLMGEVMYLPGGATEGEWRYEDFASVAVRHSDRRGPPPEGIERCADYRCFWSLNFAMRRATFLATGGFDERYAGYGGEDTDFGKVVDKAGVPIAWIKGGLAYHQYHPHHMPPVHHIDSVVRNAELFEAKWGYRTMGHWLHAFRLMGLIDDTPGRPIRILRRPDKDDLALTGQQSHQPYANTASVIRLLEERAAGSRVAA
ncbi:GT2 family glycosyltransferase [Sphingomonas sp. SORGH_AS870]|uniref:galactosyltransferase-related protein n=1 Tax=Sphingomonas sp. SORGH_AS_0870 TaxID=3041801 RepID=UPI002854CE84|nr:galactosyltransferase-related protein [Sphingomonas sp. SORGH_AS_0870]MDR6147150.1 GT2 family glycosyltransferase [Sphingomonas sp. SORGH_AS_0870]